MIKKEQVDNIEKKSDKKIVIPGEIIAEGDDFLPGENTEKEENKIVARKFGLLENSRGLMKIIPLSGVYLPRKGNVVIGRVENVTFNGWVIEINSAETAFLPISEIPGYIHKNNLDSFMDIGDVVITKILGINKRGIDLTIKSNNLGKIEEGLIISLNPNKVPRVIGREGSMIKIIKEETKCNITVGQNGEIWIKGDKIEDELLAKKAILFISQKSFINGLTDEVIKWFKNNKNDKRI
jgi:exosome complex component RRP4